MEAKQEFLVSYADNAAKSCEDLEKPLSISTRHGRY